MRRPAPPAPFLGLAGVSFGAALVGPSPLVSAGVGADDGAGQVADEPESLRVRAWRLAPADLVMVDVYGALWCVATGKRFRLIRWALERRVYVFPSLGSLCAAVQRGSVVGLLPDVAPLGARPWRSDGACGVAAVVAA